MPKHSSSSSSSRKTALPPQDHRHSSESGAEEDHDDHDDQDDDLDQDQDQDEGRPRLNGGSAPIKRKRLTQACDPCRKKKIKCDGLKPSCANCAKLSLNCTYLPSMKKRGPRQGYIELLEKRLDKMEKMLQHGPNAVDPDLLDAKLRGASEGEADDPDSFTGARTAKPDSLYFGGTSAFSHYNDSNKTMNHPFFQGDKILAATNNMTMTKTRRPIYGIRDEIPRKDILDHLIQLFFDSVYFQFPIIHPATFMKQYREGKVSPNLLNAMCAGVARFSNHPDVATTPSFLAGEPFATNVRGSLIDAVDVPSVSNVQALILLAMYEYGAARGPRAWMFGGMAIRMAQELGLNREDSSPVFYLKGDWVMRETRRRAFWSCFVMDVLASSSSGRPRMIDQRDCEVLLPSEDNAWHEARPVVTEMLDDDLDSAPNKSSSTEQQQPSPETKQSTPNDRSTDDTSNPASDSAPVGNNGSDSSTTEPRAAEQASHGDNSQSGHSLSSFAYLIRILAVLGKVSQYVNRPRTKNSIPPNEPGSEFAIIDAALKAWLNSVPPHLQYSQTNARMLKDRSEGSLIVFMHVLYHTSVVLLHRPILAADKTSFPMDSNFVETSIARCAEAAGNVSDVLDFVSAQNCPPRVYISSFFAYPVFTTATIHITNAFAQDPAVAAKARRNLSTHVRVLQTMKTYWAMADKFFYIIRDLYSIQSKISSSAANGGIIVPQVVSHNAHDDEDYPNSACNAAKAAEIERGRGKGSGKDKQEVTRHELDGLGAAPRMVINSKLASISSFLKSDSGLIALWRRATEMQVIDKANQEKRKATLAEPSIQKPSVPSINTQEEIEPSTEGEEQREQRIRMNDLEIQEINQEFERQWKSKMLVEQQQQLQQHQQQEDGTGATLVSAESYRSDSGQGRQEEQLNLDKRQTERDDLSNPRAAKLPRTAQPAHAASQGQGRSHSSRKHRSGSNPNTSMDGDAAARNTSSTTAAWTGQPGQPIYQPDASSSATEGNVAAYNHTLVQRPQQLQEFQSQQAFVMQPMLVQPRAPSALDLTQTNEVNQHLLNVYSQQRQQQEALSRTIEMRQNANIQRQQQHLQQQQQQAPVASSLAFGPPGGGGFAPAPSTYLTSSVASIPSQVRADDFQSQQQQQQQQQQQGQQAMFAGTTFAGPPLVYGSSYSHQQAPRVQTEPIDSIFDFAMPLGDLNFLSSSFQMTPMMMQEANNGRGNTMESYPASATTPSRGISGLSSAIPTSGIQPQQPRSQRPQQRARAGSATSSTSAMSPVPSATTSSPATPAVSGSLMMAGAQGGTAGPTDLTPASAKGRDPSHSKSPSQS
ncbi:hypothetical protein KVV02_000144 [Mortierella alpina]|uniref:Zn(2)-C6 fungal-type domain-containing protein n=1 Tax=Mortierella alpina TaxID=64518 RepID=A0A9P8A5N5_MORAP|nr:hypothetical protein KVV02_000144 [Mortierella alpina]